MPRLNLGPPTLLSGEYKNTYPTDKVWESNTSLSNIYCCSQESVVFYLHSPYVSPGQIV